LQIAGIILAAGKGTRMNSTKPKVLHEICGLPLFEHVGRAMREAGVTKPILVVEDPNDAEWEPYQNAYAFARQSDRRGTAHAVSTAIPALKDFEGPVFVAPGDAPLATPHVFLTLAEKLRSENAACTIATCKLNDPTGYGRVVRSDSGTVSKVVEELDASEAERNIKEVNSSFYCFDAAALRRHIASISDHNAKGEMYLTDIIEILNKAGCGVSSVLIPDSDILLGINDRWQLAQAAEIMRTRLLKALALSGVTIVSPGATFVDADVQVGRDTVIQPMTVLAGKTRIASNCEIGPGCRIVDSQVGERCVVISSQLNQTAVGEGCRIGPYANLRPGTVLGRNVRVGDYVEIKNSEIGEDATLAHLAYVGDAKIGARTNIGAGTITCNFDGRKKHRTEIGDDVFVGSNSTLVAPVALQSGSYVAAGSVITEDVPADALGIGRSRQVNKQGWAKKWKEIVFGKSQK